MKLSAHFDLSEFTRSETALRKGIDNTPSAAHIANLTRLCEQILEPVRTAAGERWPGSTVRVTSGYRCPALNAAVGGSATSAHMDGRAADVEIRLADGSEVDVLNVFAFIRGLDLPVDQVIQELGPSGWNHIGIALDGKPPRREYLVATGGPGAWKYVTAPAAVT